MCFTLRLHTSAAPTRAGLTQALGPMFDIPKMTKVATAAISEFAKSHAHETFYSFAIDANMLCLNSIQQFEITLAEYRNSSPEYYSSDEDVRELRENTGDWKYQGFFHMEDFHGFDGNLYDEHYDLAGSSVDGRSPDSDYSKAMSALVSALEKENAFAELKLSDDFVVTWMDHNY
jgi:hypothetical protein